MVNNDTHQLLELRLLERGADNDRFRSMTTIGGREVDRSNPDSIGDVVGSTVAGLLGLPLGDFLAL